MRNAPERSACLSECPMRDRVDPPQFVDPHPPGAAKLQFADVGEIPAEGIVFVIVSFLQFAGVSYSDEVNR